MNVALRFLLCLPLLVFFAGCATVPEGRGWGQDATISPGWDRVREAAVNAACDPMTWGPAAGALVFSAGDIDEEVSEWAVKHRPVFGSRNAAGEAGDDMRDVLIGSMIATGVLAPSGEDAAQWISAKSRGFAVEAAAFWTAAGATAGLKSSIHRTRPNRAGNKSFPSGHSTVAFSAAALASRNTDNLPISDSSKKVLKIGFGTLAAGTAWARVEGQHHYPSDVLAGAAIGNFLSLFVHDAFMGMRKENGLIVSVEPSRSGVIAGVRGRF